MTENVLIGSVQGGSFTSQQVGEAPGAHDMGSSLGITSVALLLLLLEKQKLEVISSLAHLAA